MSKILKGFGTRVQRSVFECDITHPQFDRLKERLTKMVDKEDGLRYYVLCSNCIQKIEVPQGATVTKAQLYFAV